MILLVVTSVLPLCKFFLTSVEVTPNWRRIRSDEQLHLRGGWGGEERDGSFPLELNLH